MKRQKRNRALSLAVLALGFCGVGPGWAAVTPGGDATVAATTSQDTIIGNTTTGTLNVDGGSLLRNSIGYLGFTAGSLGTAVVSDLGSTWTNNNSLVVGSSGTGALTIQAGGQVTSNIGVIGKGGQSSGTVTVTGAGSSWGNYASLDVGWSGSGVLNVEAGAQVDSSWGRIGYNAGSTGTVTVSGAGSRWTGGTEARVGYSGTGTINVGDGGELLLGSGCYYGYNSGSSGTLRLTGGGRVSSGSAFFGNLAGATGAAIVSGTGSSFSSNDDLRIGFEGSGTLTIEDGGQVSNDDGLIGQKAGSTGAATVSGATSAWTNRDELWVGFAGQSTLSIQSGARVSSSIGYLGYDAGASGDATVTGAGSTWTNSGVLYVGRYGSGTLTVANGGTVTAQTLFASSGNVHGNGTITANGAVLDADLIFNQSHGTTQTMTFGSGVTLNLIIDGTGRLGAGHQGSGSMSITDGVVVSSTSGWVGAYPGSSGTVTVSGTGSAWTNSEFLSVGRDGSGTLSIEDGALVSSKGASIGSTTGSTGMATVSGTGSKWIDSDNLYVGNGGSGRLTVTDGASVTTKTLFASASDLEGNGTITANGAVLDADLVFDRSHASTQTLTFGTGGTLKLVIDGSGSLGAGHKGRGSLRIADGAAVSSSYGYIGYRPGANGAAAVIGAGSTWTTSTLGVGRDGSGTLSIEGGGHVSSTSGFIGYGTGSSGTATVSGAGSQWISSGTLYVGNYGAGKLIVLDSGKVSAKQLSINSQSMVQLNVSGSDMIVLGDAATTGSVTNNGTISLFANVLLPAGTYRPISEYAGRTMSFSGSGGAYNTVGGTWSTTSKTFSVSPATALAAGVSDRVSNRERLLFTHGATGQRAGASFGIISGIVNFAAAPMDTASVTALEEILGSGGEVLSAWDFTTNFSGGEAMLSFDVGTGADGLEIWHYSGGVWSEFTPGLFTYDGDGIASFTVSSFSGYAVTAAVPEPGTMGLLALAGSALLIRRRVRG